MKKENPEWKNLRAFITLALLILANVSLAQRNFIEVPTSEIVEKGDTYFQQSFSISDRNITSSTVVTWGLGHNFEMGFNLQQVTFNTRPQSKIVNLDPEEPSQNPDLLMDLQKGFILKEWSSIEIGTRSGVNISEGKEKVKFSTFTYFNTQFSIPETEHKLILGTNYANTSYAGHGNRWAFMAGAEVEVIKEKFHLIGEFISGKNSLSLIHAGFQIILPKKMQIGFAAQLPVPGSDNHHGGVIQISRK